MNRKLLELRIELNRRATGIAMVPHYRNARFLPWWLRKLSDDNWRWRVEWRGRLAADFRRRVGEREARSLVK